MSTTPARRWWRLHLSTWLVVAAAAFLLAILMLPGYDEEYFDWMYPDRLTEATLSHGWPWTFLTRTVSGPPARVPWCSLGAWSIRGEERRFDAASLAADGGLALSVILGVAALFEFRRRRRSRFWQFSLKEVGCVVTAAALVSAHEGWKYRTYRREQAAKNAVVGFEFAEAYAGPMWLKRLAGYEVPYYSAAQSCESNGRAAVEDLGEIRQFRRLEYIDLDGLDATDEALRALFSDGGLTDVRELYLGAAPESDAGLASLHACRYLRVLHAGGQGVRGEFLATLTCVNSLEEINLADCDISDEALVDLQRFPRLKHINLDGTRVTDRGLAMLSSMSRLEIVCLSGTAVSDVGMAHLSSLPDLHAIDVSDTAVTGDGLRHVRNARYLDLGGTKFDASDLPTLLEMRSLRVLLVSQAIATEARALLEGRSSCSVGVSSRGRTPTRFGPNGGPIFLRWPGDIVSFVGDAEESP